jgi:hypothetical protein
MNEILTDMDEHDEMKKKAMEIVNILHNNRPKSVSRTTMSRRVRFRKRLKNSLI